MIMIKQAERNATYTDITIGMEIMYIPVTIQLKIYEKSPALLTYRHSRSLYSTVCRQTIFSSPKESIRHIIVRRLLH